jgi:hypothetical protein
VISADVVTADGHIIHCDIRIRHNLGLAGRFREFCTLNHDIAASRVVVDREFRTIDGASASYSGPEVRLGEIALDSIRIVGPNSGRLTGN